MRPTFPSIHDTIPKSAFTENPFKKGRKSDEILQIYNLDATVINNRKLYSDFKEKNINLKISPPTLFFKDRNGNSILDEETEDYVFFTTIISSTKQSELEDIYNNITPYDYEFILLLENNSTDILSSAKYYIKVGKEISEYILSIANNKETNNLFNTVLNASEISQEQLSSDDLIGLLKKGNGVFNDSTQVESILFYIFYDLSLATNSVAWVSEKIETFLDWIINSIESLKISEDRWNPATAQDGKFKPYFFPFYRIPKDVRSQIPKTFDLYVNSIVASLLGSPSNNSDTFVNKTLENVIEPIRIALAEKLKDLLPQLLKKLEGLIELGLTKGLEYLNAFLCGLINSIISAVSGIVWMIKLPFTFISTLKDEGDRTEFFDELIENVRSFDFSNLFLNIEIFLFVALDYISNISLIEWIEALDISVAQVGYFTGCVVEFVLEIIIGILLTEGVLAVNAVIRKIIKEPVELLRLIAKEIDDILKSAVSIVKSTKKYSYKLFLCQIRKLINCLTKY